MSIINIPTLPEILEKLKAFKAYMDAEGNSALEYINLLEDYKLALSLLIHINYRIKVNDLASIEKYFDDLMFILNYRTRVEYSYDHLNSFDDYLLSNADGGGAIGDWADLLNKPATFPPADHDHAFDWNRVIKVGDFAGRNLYTESGAEDVSDGLETLLFPFVQAKLSIGSSLVYEQGTENGFTINGNFNPNDEEIVNSLVLLNGAGQQLHNYNIPDPLETTVISHNVENLTANESYRFRANVGQAGTDLYSPYLEVEFVHPLLWGFSLDEDLRGVNAYQQLRKIVSKSTDRSVVMEGENGYMYYFSPLSLGKVTGIKDENNFTLNAFLESETQVSVQSSGLSNDFTTNYYRYRSPFQASINQEIYFSA